MRTGVPRNKKLLSKENDGSIHRPGIKSRPGLTSQRPPTPGPKDDSVRRGGRVFQGLLSSLILALVFSQPLLLAETFIDGMSGSIHESDSTERSDSVSRSSEPRPIGEIRKDAKAFIKRSKLTDDPIAANGAIVDLCYLHWEIVNDPRFPTYEVLKNLRATIATRLKRVRRDLTLELRRRERSRQREQQGDSRSSSSRSSSIANESTGENGGGEAEDETGDVGALPNDDRDDRVGASDRAAAEALYRNASAMNRITGGPVQVWSYVGGNFGPFEETASDLIELIESTINPDFWQSHGGNGVIEYYSPLRILVISASSQVQDNVTDLLNQLRQLSR